jgi:hypothetical protein
MTASGIYQMIARRGRECGVDVFPHRFRHHFSHTWQVSGVALDASFGRSGERACPAVQRAALEQAQRNGSPRTLRDLGCHHPLASGRTMLQPVRLQLMPE